MQNNTAKKLIKLSDVHLANMQEIAEDKCYDDVVATIQAKLATVQHILIHSLEAELDINTAHNCSYVLNDVQDGIKTLGDLCYEVESFLYAIKNPQYLAEVTGE